MEYVWIYILAFAYLVWVILVIADIVDRAKLYKGMELLDNLSDCSAYFIIIHVAGIPIVLAFISFCMWVVKVLG